MRTRLTIGGKNIDLKGGDEIITDLKLFDISNPQIRKGIVSRTIEVEATDNNAATFGLFYRWDIASSSFDATARIDCELISGGTTVLYGYAQLLGTSEIGGIVTFTLALFGSVTDFMQQAQGIDLTELDFSDLNHEWNASNIQATWEDNYLELMSSGYYYPMIDYGQLPSADRIDTPQISISYDVEQFYPAIYLRKYIDKIAAACGKTIQSDFFDSITFRKIGLPYAFNNVPQLPQSEAVKSLFQAGVSHYDIVVEYITGSGYQLSTIFAPVLNWTPFNDDSTGDYFDGSTVYNTTNKEFTANRTGNYSFGVQLSGYLAYSSNFIVGQKMRIRFDLYKNGFVSQSQYFDYLDTDYYWDGAPGTLPKLLIQNLTFEETGVTIGDFYGVAISFEPYWYGGGTPTPVSWLFWGISDQLDQPNCTWWRNQRLTNNMSEGDTWDMNIIQPKGVKASDILNLVTTQFNLIWEVDTVDKNIIRAEPYKDYYSGGNVKDWTAKLDHSKVKKVEPTANKAPKVFALEYADGNGYFDKGYKQKYNEAYGSTRRRIPSEWANGELKRSVIASAPISAGYGSSPRIYPRFFDIDKDGNILKQTGGFRVAYFNTLPLPDGSTSVSSSYVMLFNGSPVYLYPYAGHLDNPYNPSLDLCFDAPREIYWTTRKNSPVIMQYTNANLFNVYWLEYLNQMYSTESRTMTAWFLLSPFDIQQFRFNDTIIVQGVAYRVLSINEYSTDMYQPCEVVLQKVIDTVPFVEVVKPVSGGDGDLIGDTPMPSVVEK